MYSVGDKKKLTIINLLSCIYLSVILTFIAYNGSLYFLGKRTTSYVLVIILLSEFMKVTYLRNCNINQTVKKHKQVKINRAGETIKSFFFILASVFVYFFAIILFGAPFLDQHEETLMLSLFLVLVTIFPLVHYVGIDNSLQLLSGVKSFDDEPVIEMLMRNIVMTLAGVWIGAIVIPLDWNRPWQEWPLPCYLGGITGYLGANVASVLKDLSPFHFNMQQLK